MAIPRNRRKAYDSMVRQGMSKQKAAAISWAGKTKAGRKNMTPKASRPPKPRKPQGPPPGSGSRGALRPVCLTTQKNTAYMWRLRTPT